MLFIRWCILYYIILNNITAIYTSRLLSTNYFTRLIINKLYLTKYINSYKNGKEVFYHIK